MSEVPEKRIVHFYIDGFNFYFGLRRIADYKPDWRKFYWIDLVKLCSEFLSDNEVLGKVTYFTARPKGRDKMERQNIFLNCNRRLNPELLEVVYGRYSNKELKCNAKGGCRKNYNDLEEKETDVNLAIQMVIDAYDKVCDKMVLISGDTDFVPPLKIIKSRHTHVQTMILFPPGHYSAHLSQICPNNKALEKYKPKWNRAILPDNVMVEGKTFIKPTSWSVKK